MPIRRQKTSKNVNVFMQQVLIHPTTKDIPQVCSKLCDSRMKAKGGQIASFLPWFVQPEMSLCSLLMGVGKYSKDNSIKYLCGR